MTESQPEAKRACRRCYGRAVSVHELESVGVVSQYGAVHQSAYFRGEGRKTLCGIDASSDKWWWRL